jgi:hypothetical protein
MCTGFESGAVKLRIILPNVLDSHGCGLRLRLGATMLRHCARLSAGRADVGYQELVDRTRELEDQVIRGASDTIRRCVVAMRAWRAFYWCHNATRDSPRPFVSREYPASVVQVALQSLAEIREGGGVGSYGQGARDPLHPLLGGAVHEMLLVYAGQPASREPGGVNYGDLYERDAGVWGLVVAGSSSEATRRAVAGALQYSVKTATKKQVDKSVERYLYEHHQLFRRVAKWMRE